MNFLITNLSIIIFQPTNYINTTDFVIVLVAFYGNISADTLLSCKPLAGNNILIGIIAIHLIFSATILTEKKYPYYYHVLL